MIICSFSVFSTRSARSRTAGKENSDPQSGVSKIGAGGLKNMLGGAHFRRYVASGAGQYRNQQHPPCFFKCPFTDSASQTSKCLFDVDEIAACIITRGSSSVRRLTPGLPDTSALQESSAGGEQAPTWQALR